VEGYSFMAREKQKPISENSPCDFPVSAKGWRLINQQPASVAVNSLQSHKEYLSEAAEAWNFPKNASFLIGKVTCVFQILMMSHNPAISCMLK
jgi:hypothetical protein